MTNKLKLCIDARMINSSGIGSYIQNLIPHLLNRFDIWLLGQTNELADFKVAAIVDFKSPIYSIAEQFEFSRNVPTCDIFWSPHYNIPVVNIPACKRITTIHDVFHLAFYEELSLKQKLYAKFMINKAVKKSDLIITVSNFSKNEIVKYTTCPEKKINVIYNGVNQVSSVKPIQQISVKYNLPSSYLLFVGNVKPHKNLKKLLAAYLLLDASLQQQYKIVIVGKKDGFIKGDDDLFHWIKNQPLLLSNLVFTGYVLEEDLDTLYSNAALFVFPSVYEGFGLPPLEAMKNKCAIALSDIPSLKEVCGDAACYFDPHDALDICNRLTDVLTSEHLRQELVQRGQERIRSFSWENTADEHIKLFNQVINSI